MFKDKIKELRIKNHLTQEQLADKLYVSRSAIAKWEQGRGIPKHDTVIDIANLFNVPVDSFYEQDAVHEVIEVIEKDNKKKTFILISIIAVLIISLTSSLIYTFSKKDFVPYSEFDSFINEETLKNFSLQNMQEGDSFIDQKVNYRSEKNIDYYSKINDYDSFVAYADYILSFLLSSPYISYVGYNANVIIDDSVLLYDEIYLLSSSELNKYIYYGNYNSFYGNLEKTSTTEYQFYYLNKLPSSYKKGEKISVSRITLNFATWNVYSGKLFVDDDKGEYNFYMSITKDCYGDYYFFDDYFETKTIVINEQNFNDYFTFRVNTSAIVYYAIVTDYIFYDAFVEVEAYLGDDSKNTTATTYIRSSDIGGGFDVKELYGYYDNNLKDFVFPYKLTIQEGYISFAIPK